MATGSGTAGNITLDLNNSFGSLQISGVNASVTESDSMNLASSTLAQSLHLNSGGAILQTGSLSVTGTFSAAALGAITLDSPGNAFAVIGNVSRGGAMSLVDSKGGLVVAGAINGGTTSNDVTIEVKAGPLTIAGPSRVAITGQVITLASPQLFTNSAGGSALNTGPSGRYIIYCKKPSVLGGLLFSGTEGSKSYPAAPSAEHSSGNVLISNN